MKKDKIHFAVDKSNKQNHRRINFINKYKNHSPKNADVIVVLGGDGFMLQTLKKLRKFKKPFYGMNTGSYGFLMNKFRNKDFQKHLSKSRPITISALQMIVKTKSRKVRRGIAINEISMFRQSKQTASLQIRKGKNIFIKKLVSDGVLISTPAGSTAYNLSVHGPILSLNSKKLAITPISPFRPRRWKGGIVSDKSVIHISNLNINKRPVSVVADNVEVRNVKYVKVNVSPKIKFNLLYDSKKQFEPEN